MPNRSADIEAQRVLRLAFLYGSLEERKGKVFLPGAPGKSICGEAVLRSLVSRGWLEVGINHRRFDITDAGKTQTTAW